MGRREKEGLEYCAIDVDIFDDPKLLFVCERFGEKGELITLKLLLYIYKQGYYCEWNNEIAVLFANRRLKNISYDLLNDVVGELLKRRFFDEGLFKSFGILTSKGIQQRWTEIVTRAKRKCRVAQEHDLFLPKKKEEMPSKKEETPAFEEEMTSEQEEMQQSKVKESKENKSKEKRRKEYRRQILKKAKVRQRQKKSPNPGSAPPLSPVVVNPAIAVLLPSHMEKLCDEAKKDKLVLEWAIRQGIKPENISKLLDEFLQHCKNHRKDHQSLQQFQQHLVNWYPKRKSNGSKANTGAGSRPSAAVIPAGRRDYGKP